MEPTVFGTIKSLSVKDVKRSVANLFNLSIIRVFLSTLFRPISLTVSSITGGSVIGKPGWFSFTVYLVISKMAIRDKGN